MGRGLRDWLGALQDAYAIQNIVALRPELPFWVIRQDRSGGLDWMELTDPSQRPKPFHFEIYFGKDKLRDRHYVDALEEARATSGLVERELLGFWDLFYAMPEDEERLHLPLHRPVLSRLRPTGRA